MDEPDNEDGLNSEWLDDLDALDRDPLNECLDESRDSVGVSTKASYSERRDRPPMTQGESPLAKGPEFS